MGHKQIDAVRELNNAIGILRAVHEYIADNRKLLVDNSVPALPHIIGKEAILDSIRKAEIATDRAVCHLSGYPYLDKSASG